MDGYYIPLAYVPINYAEPIDGYLGEHIAMIDRNFEKFSNIVQIMPPPSGGDDIPILQEMIDRAKLGSTIIIPGNVIPYQWLSTLVPKSDLKIWNQSGAVWNFNRPYGLGVAPLSWTVDGGPGGT